MITKKSSLFFSIIIIFSINSYSLSIEPDIFVQSTVNRAAETLGSGLTKEQRIEELKNCERHCRYKGNRFLFIR